VVILSQVSFVLSEFYVLLKVSTTRIAFIRGMAQKNSSSPSRTNSTSITQAPLTRNFSRLCADHISGSADSRFNSASFQCLADLKACKQTNIPIYSFTEHQRLDETKYLYGGFPPNYLFHPQVHQICIQGATIIIAEGIMALLDPALRALYDLKVWANRQRMLRFAHDTL
jgi:hypothetical protein